MATVARSLSRAAWSVARQTIPARQSTRCSCPIPQPPRRPFSVTPFLRSRQPDDIEAPAALADGSDDQNDEALELRRGGGDMEESDEFMDASILREIDQEVTSIERQMPLSFNAGKMKMGYWGEDEEDEFAQIEDDDDDYHEDAITSMAHAELEQHRELREYARIIAWDMPSLSALAKPFILPPQTHILRFRYTTYMGETHPAESKVVLELSSKDLTPTYLTEEQRLTLLKLVGVRYNPDKDIIRMSCEKFPSRAQNKRYLGDMIEKLIKEAKEGDSFADIPLDLRHRKPKKRLTFPEEWALTEERKKQLEEARPALSAPYAKVVDGNEVIAVAVQRVPALNQASPRGEMGAGPKGAVGMKVGRGPAQQRQTKRVW